MIHYRILGWLWLLLGVFGLALNGIECVRLLRLAEGWGEGAMISTLLGFGVCALAASASIDFFRARGWARIVFCVVAFLLGLHSLSFLAIVGLGFGQFDYTLSWLGVALAAYTLLTVAFARRTHEPTVG